MKNCNVCGQPMDDNAAFCTKCGTPFAQNQANPGAQQQTYAQPAAAVVDPYDHTAEFDPKDISDNKVIAMLVYLLGAIGIIIALLAANQSAYAGFHVRQALKFTVAETLLFIIAGVLAFTIIVPIAALICICVLEVIKIICFFQICGGKAKEPAIIRSLKFMK